MKGGSRKTKKKTWEGALPPTHDRFIAEMNGWIKCIDTIEHDHPDLSNPWVSGQHRYAKNRLEYLQEEYRKQFGEYPILDLKV